MSSNKPFVSKTRIALKCLPLIVTIVLLIYSIVQQNAGYIILVAIWGGLFSVGKIKQAMQMMRNLRYINSCGLYMLMLKEQPQHKEADYVVTPNFVFSFNQRLCIPISAIQSVDKCFVRCANNYFKSRGVLQMHLNNGDSYEFIRYIGLTERQIATIQCCIRDLYVRNPKLGNLRY